MQNDFAFDAPKEELYTDVILEYTERGSTVKGDGVANAGVAGGASTAKRRKFERLDITGSSGRLAVEGFVKIGRVNGSDLATTTNPETFAIDDYENGDANTGAEFPDDVLNVNDYIKVDNEIMKVTARDSSSTQNVTVTRAQFGTTAASHADNAFIYRNPLGDADDWGSRPFGQTEILNNGTSGGAFGRIEYQSHYGGSSLENEDPPGFIIVSPFGAASDTDDLNFNAHMPESSVTVTGSTSSNTVTTMATCRYAKNVGIKKTKIIKNTTSSDPADLRKQVVSFLSRNTQTAVKRGEFKVSGYPYTYINAAAAKVSTSGNTITFASASFTDNAGVTTNDPRLFGVLIGDVICEMDSTATTITRYAYISSVTATTVDYGANVNDTSDGTALDTANKPMRIYVPLRAGHVIRVENTLVDVDEDHLVSEIVYDEGSGVSFASLSTIGQNDSAMSFKPNILKAVNDNAIKYGKEPAEGVVNFPETTGWTMNAELTGSDTDTIAWAKYVAGGSPSGNFQLTAEDGTYVYDINAGNTGNMTAGAEYILYLAPETDATAFSAELASTYEKDKKKLQIATMKAEASPSEATYELFQNISTTGGGNPGVKALPTKILSPSGRVLSDDGTNSAPTFSFTSDPNTGMYQYGDDQLGFAVNGTAIALISASGLLIGVTVASDIDLQINASSGLVTKVSSSKRYKDNIADLNINTENIYNLRPVSFDWKSNGKSDFGFIAEEVHDILPELVIYNEDTTPEAVKYKQLSVLMLEELKKLREEVKALKEKI